MSTKPRCFPEAVPLKERNALSSADTTVPVDLGSANPDPQRLTGLLVQAIRYALQQKEQAATMRSLALTDELTGLYNRRGFLELARQQLKLARRTRQRILFVYADVDNLKQINDTYGHAEGDRVIQAAARVLQRTLRDSDILSRFGGDEFVILAYEAPDHGQAIIAERLRRNLRQHNTRNADRGYALSLSVGFAPFNSGLPASVDQLLRRADESMYRDKRAARNGSGNGNVESIARARARGNSKGPLREKSAS